MSQKKPAEPSSGSSSSKPRITETYNSKFPDGKMQGVKMVREIPIDHNDQGSSGKKLLGRERGEIEVSMVADMKDWKPESKPSGSGLKRLIQKETGDILVGMAVDKKQDKTGGEGSGGSTRKG